MGRPGSGALRHGAVLMCFAPHPAPLRPEYQEIDWQTPRRDGRVRVVEWTCDCRRPVYELCGSGGLYYLRRTAQGERAAESGRAIWAETHRLWIALLTGRAR
ncbi:hypothetical protein GCM10010412_055270 [Nonomuraea recticatena]|uniref:Uncharacterized protein n=1 Tax=Nonomuraea recticatena TaxID=46178 RepID=A0ABP6ERH5_9ACTN